MTYKYFGLYGLGILALGLVFILLKWPQNRNMTFSQHVARRTSSIIYYIVLFSIVLPLLIAFFVRWFTPTLKINLWFDGLVVASSACQYACTLIPETGGWKSAWHRAWVGMSALCLVPALIIILVSSTVMVPARIITAIGILTMAYVVYKVIANKGTPKNFLLLQSAYFCAFFIPALYVSYLQ